LNYGDEYFIGYGYFNASGAFVSSSTTYFTISHGIVTIDVDGNVVGCAPATSFSVPDDACAVDLRGIETLPSITKNDKNKNCLYFVDEGKSLDGITENVVIGGVAANVVLEDNLYGFYTPIDFTATNISYTRTETSYLDKTSQKGWTTIVLPFAPAGIETYVGKTRYELEWFKNASETNKNLWLMEFYDEHDGIVEFGYAGSTLEANKPYIMGLPGDSYGNKWSLKGLPITFYAADATIKANAKAVITGTNYKFVGTTLQQGSMDNIYKLNLDGDQFVKGTASIDPFRAFFAPTSTAATAELLSIGFGGSTTAIQTMDVERGTLNDNNVYNLNGQRVAQPTKGLYIVNGRKVVIK
jgi:hypothetical protein